jgi:hypothetical protein
VPNDVDLTASGDSLVIGLFGRGLGIVDLTKPTLTLSTLPLTALDSALGQYPARVRVLSTGHAFLSIYGNQPSAYTLLDVDLATGAQRVRSDAAVNGVVGVVHMERSLDRSVLIINEDVPSCLRRYVAATDAFSSCVTPWVRDWQPVVDGTGQRFAIGTDVYDASLQKLPKLGPNLTPGAIPYSALSSDGQSLFEILGPRGIIRLNAGDGRLLDKTPNPVMQTMQPRLSPDGKTMVLLSGTDAEAKIAVIDLR